MEVLLLNRQKYNFPVTVTPLSKQTQLFLVNKTLMIKGTVQVDSIIVFNYKEMPRSSKRKSF
jgi:hypothetical protein